MKNFTKLFLLITVSVCGVLLFQGQDANQNNPDWDSPILDRKPLNLVYGHSFIPSGAQMDMPPVTSADGYDNYNMGFTAFGEVHMSMNPNNPLYIFASYNSSGAVGTVPFVTSNGGLTWGYVNPTWGATMFGDPAGAYDSLGNLYHENMTGTGTTITGTRIAKSTTSGYSWVSVVPGNSGNDKNWLCADQTGGPYANYIYSTMTNFSSCNFARSTDNGATFNVTTALTPHNLPGAMPCVGPNGSIQGGSVYVVTNAGGAFSPVYGFFRSTDGGQTFTTQSTQAFANCVGDNVGGRHSVQNMRTRPYPFIAADNSYGPYRGRLYVIYASNNPAGCGNKSDIFCRYSTDFGVSWSSEVTVNDDANSINNYQWHPAMWCDKTTGRLHVNWMDTRNTPTSDSAEIYATYSTNGGASFMTNQKLSNAKMKINCATCPGGGTPRYQGDYNSVASNSITAMHSWTDFRLGGFGSFAGYMPDFAMKSRPALDTLTNIADTTYYWVSIPSVKLYSSYAKFTAAFQTPPGSGTVTFTFLNKTSNVVQDSLSSYPDSLRLRVVASGGVTIGLYTIQIKGSGPNGTPVHQRDVQLRVVVPIGIISLGNEIPNKFNLYQNYPNPFNPKTNIRFDIAKSGLVKLKVFDITGRLVAELINKELSVGRYMFDFDGSGIASGIYFYRLETPDFTDIKKMILVK